MKLPRLTVARRLVLFTLLFTLLPVSAAAVMNYRTGHAMFEEQARQALSGRADALAAQLDQFNAAMLATARLVAGAPLVGAALGGAGPDHEAPRWANELLKRTVERDARLVTVAIVDATGVLRFSARAEPLGTDLSARAFVREALAGGEAVSEVRRAHHVDGALPVIAYAAPVRDGGDVGRGRVIGAIVVVARAQALWDVVERANGLAGAGSFAVLTDELGVRIAHSARADLLFHPTGPLTDEQVNDAVALARFGDQTRELLTSPKPTPVLHELSVAATVPWPPAVHRGLSVGSGTENFIVPTRLSTAPWTVFMQVPVASALQVARGFGTRAVGVAALLGALAIALGVLFTRGLVARVAALGHAADALARGDEGRAPEAGTDELAELGRRFNQMAEAVDASKKTLEERVRARTAELQGANEELRAQGRELSAQADELRVQQVELQRKNAEVERADRLKTEFLANMSHELRTPLSSVIGFTELVIEEAPLDAQHRKYLGDVIASAKHLLSLINDILDLAKIEAGHATLSHAALRPADAVAEAISLVEGAALTRGLQFVSEISASQDVRADEGKLRQILVNLLSNAVKFSPARGTIRVVAVDAGEEIAFSVEDAGPGVDDALKALLFTPFVQGESPFAKRHQGTGLGLAICKRLVELHGGHIAHENVVPHGARFTFTLPATARVDLPADAPLVVIAANGHTDRIVSLLTAAGYQSRVVRDDEDPGDVAAGSGAVAVIVDASSEVRDGISLVDRLERRADTCDLPVLVTAVPTAAFLPKPLDDARLLAKLRLATTPPAAVLSIDDDVVVGELLKRILEPAGYRLRSATSGAEGLAEARRQRPDVVIVDLNLGDMSGFDVIDALAGDATLHDVPVMVLTAADLSAEDLARLRARARAVAEKGSATPDELIAALARATRAPRGATGKVRAKILVVDDNDLNRELARGILERAGYLVVLAQDGQEALAAARRDAPDVILMDLAMPVLDGFEATRALAADPTTARIPVIAVTAMAMRADEERAYAAGVRGYLTKPIDRRALEEVIGRVLRKAPAAGG